MAVRLHTSMLPTSLNDSLNIITQTLELQKRKYDLTVLPSAIVFVIPLLYTPKSLILICDFKSVCFFRTMIGLDVYLKDGEIDLSKNHSMELLNYSRNAKTIKCNVPTAKIKNWLIYEKATSTKKFPATTEEIEKWFKE